VPVANWKQRTPYNGESPSTAFGCRSNGCSMFSRRHFLRAGTITAGASFAVFAPSRNREETSSPLPPSIASLRSMKDQAKPITAEEHTARQEKARQLMAANHIDALLLMEGTSLEYFAGVQWWGGERLFALVLPAKGRALCVCPAFEEGRAREQLAASPEGNNADVRTWQEDQNPYQLLAQGFNDLGISTGTLGVEERVRFVFSDGIAKAGPQLAQLIVAANERLGFPGEVDIDIGENSSFPHGSIVPQVIREGTLVLIDGGGPVEGYQSDISRTFVFGKPSDKMKKIFDIVHRAQTAALKTARPGVECQAVDAAARKVISDAGYGPDYKFFTHRLGHGIGMDGHEWPYLVHGNTTLLARNMTFSDEPGIYIPGEFGVRLEDDMHILDDRAELFTPQSPSLEDPFGKV